MSSTYINTRVTAEAVRMEDLRRKEAEAREAARREAEAREAAAREARRREEAARQAQRQKEAEARKAAEREARKKEAEAREVARREAEAREAAEREARRKEAEAQAIRQRIDHARAAIAAQDQRYQAAVGRLDQARARLPDLQLATRPFPEGAPDNGQSTPDAWEAHAAQVAQGVSDFERVIEAAILEAEHQLERRHQLAAAWLQIDDVCAEAALRLGRIETLARQVGATAQVRPLSRPAADLDLEHAHAELARLRVALSAIQQEESRLETQRNTAQRAQALSGTAAHRVSAEQAHTAYLTTRESTARATLQGVIDESLHAHQLQEAALPDSLRLQLQHLLTSATAQDGSEHARILLAREANRQRGIAKAQALLTQVPAGMADQPDLIRRWAALTGQLQRIIAGQEPMIESIEREYQQLQSDAQHRLGGAYALADWVRALHQAGIRALATEEENRWVLLDDSAPGSWILATLYADEDGALNIKTELFKEEDARPDPQADVKAVKSACAKLQQAAQQTDQKVGAAAQEVERDPHLRRKRRPPAKRQMVT